jgi:hypothetical protein
MDESAVSEVVGRAQALIVQGDQEGARALYQVEWDAAASAGDQYRACVVAHFMAHAQSQPEAQLSWHLRALDAADAVGNERVAPFYPSLYANIAEVALRLGDLPRARRYSERASATEHTLGDDGYGRMIRALIARVAEGVEPSRRVAPNG